MAHEIKLETKIETRSLQTEVDAIWTEMNGGSKCPIEVRRSASGFDVTTLVVVFGPLAAKMAGDLWVHIFLPRLKQKFGVDAVKLAD